MPLILGGLGMLVSCPRCGGVHPRGQCPKKVTRNYKKYLSEAVRFRRTASWQHKRLEILERDRFLCKCCLAQEFGYQTSTEQGFDMNYSALDTKHLQVHHITPIEEEPDKKLDDDNLISLCSYHHWMADKGLINRATLRKFAATPPGTFLNLGVINLDRTAPLNV